MKLRDAKKLDPPPRRFEWTIQSRDCVPDENRCLCEALVAEI